MANGTRTVENRKRLNISRHNLCKTKMTGKMSIFGGGKDGGMAHDEGLALWEHDEADKRPDLFLPRSKDLTEGSSKRLRPDALYFAYRFANVTRDKLQQTVWRLTNLKNGKSVMVSLADWGPNEKTGRTFDISPRAAEFLGVQTDDEISGEPLT